MQRLLLDPELSSLSEVAMIAFRRLREVDAAVDEQRANQPKSGRRSAPERRVGVWRSTPAAVTATSGGLVRVGSTAGCASITIAFASSTFAGVTSTETGTTASPVSPLTVIDPRSRPTAVVSIDT